MDIRMDALVLQVFNDFIAAYNTGDVLVLVAVLAALLALAQRSNQLFSLHLLTFGLLFMILPGNMLEPAASSLFSSIAMYKFFGLALLALAPIIYTISRQ
jgi:hypothetical protein